MMMTEDIYKKLIPFEENLRTAKVANYSRYISRDNGLILRDEIYNVLFNTQDKRNVGCGKCILSMLQRIAPYYFEYKENKEKISTTVNNVEVEGYTGRTCEKIGEEEGTVGTTEAKPAKRASVSKTKAKAQSNKAGSRRQSKKG